MIAILFGFAVCVVGVILILTLRPPCERGYCPEPTWRDNLPGVLTLASGVVIALYGVIYDK